MVRGGRGTTSLYRVNFTFGRFFIFFSSTKIVLFSAFSIYIGIIFRQSSKIQNSVFFPSIIYFFLFIFFRTYCILSLYIFSFVFLYFFALVEYDIKFFFFHYFHHIYLFLYATINYCPIGARFLIYSATIFSL